MSKIKISNKKLIILLLASIIIILSSLYIFTVIDNIKYENENFISIEKIDDIANKEETKAYLEYNSLDNFYKLSNRSKNNYYLNFESNIIVYGSIENIKDNKIKGTIKPLKKENLNSFKDKDTLCEISNCNLYLDSTNIIEKPYTIKLIISITLLILGIMISVISLILLIIKNKTKLPKFIFIISFMPYILGLIYAIIGLFSGTSFLFNHYTGIEAFITNFEMYIWMFGFYIPILEIVLIYQIIYIILKRKKSRCKK